MATSHEIVIDGKPFPATDFQNAPDMIAKGKDSNHIYPNFNKCSNESKSSYFVKSTDHALSNSGKQCFTH